MAAIGYLGLIGAGLLLENTLLFRSRHNNYWLKVPADSQVQEVWLRSAAGECIHAWWRPCPEALGAILFCHGQGGNISHRGEDIAAVIQATGKSVLVFDYPGFGQSEGSPSEAGCYAAADAAFDWLSRKVPAEQIVILGQSLGGGVAADLASRRPHRALVLFKTFTSVPDLAQEKFPFLPARLLVHNRFDTMKKILSCGAPKFIVHGENDHLIPLSQAKALFDAAPEPKRFLLLKERGHHGGLHPEFLAGLAVFLKDEVP